MDEKKEVKMGLTEEDVRREQDAGPAGLFRAMGDSLADADAIAASEDGRAIAERMAVMAMDEDSEQSKAYWRGYEKGLIKETHGDRADRLNRWASYVPVAYEAAPGRRFPLIFCLHGAHNPIQLAESYGVMQLAAREECIVIAPENENLDNILALLDYAKEHYPVDGSRVYSIGYSFGGFMTSRNVLARPELFAGAGMGGMLFAGDVRAHELDGQFYPEYRLTEEMLRRAEALEVPALLFMGEREMLCLEPLHREPEGTSATASLTSPRRQSAARSITGGASEAAARPSGSRRSSTPRAPTRWCGASARSSSAPRCAWSADGNTSSATA